ncbi:N-acetylglucosaminidase [Clostridium sp. ZS2-4]|uniref:N-acetylglucosaminidase n=1 Tax=Clostridium sp. ZS2-4 TaxID=2987703 RepID=UPI00227B7551|nr:glucosaminidase domain-containing protein [Clostridium sp. ZS2-4]MCY6354907.1 glucosaminidase domain-containing protein [Clostridium sp. ZS2-4]
MRKVSNLIKTMFITVLFLTMSVPALAEDLDVSEMPARTETSTIKPWTVNFNMDLDKSSINESNITVTDNKDKPLKVNVTSGKDAKAIVISPPVGGYDPKGTYWITLSTNVRSVSGKKMSKPVKMKFTTANQYEDSTKFTSLPIINNIKFIQKTIFENQKVDFNIYSNYSGDVQYRAFIFEYPNETYDNPRKYPDSGYTELTRGYTSAKSAVNPYTLSLYKGFAKGKYKLLVYVKRADKAGKYKNSNTDYDNYYSTYFKVLDSSIIEDRDANATIVYKDYSKTLDEAVQDQVAGAPIFSDTGWNVPSENLIKYYMNANNFLDDYGKYLFLNLNYMDGVTAEELNAMLKGKGVLDGKGEVFLQAAKDSDINPIYLVSHAMLETGNGTSELANGILVSSVEGKPVESKVSYNMFGVHAYDHDPNGCGSEYAYTEGWFTVDEAILGGAKYISTGYINSDKYKQNTLYKMKWNIEVTWHQYATDIGWARKQISRIKELMEQCKGAKPVYEIPNFK